MEHGNERIKQMEIPADGYSYLVAGNQCPRNQGFENMKCHSFLFLLHKADIVLLHFHPHLSRSAALQDKFWWSYRKQKYLLRLCQTGGQFLHYLAHELKPNVLESEVGLNIRDKTMKMKIQICLANIRL